MLDKLGHQLLNRREAVAAAEHHRAVAVAADDQGLEQTVRVDGRGELAQLVRIRRDLPDVLGWQAAASVRGRPLSQSGACGSW